jgi:hypothetical protein
VEGRRGKKKKSGENDLFLFHSKGINHPLTNEGNLPSFHLQEKSLSQLTLQKDG